MHQIAFKIKNHVRQKTKESTCLWPNRFPGITRSAKTSGKKYDLFAVSRSAANTDKLSKSGANVLIADLSNPERLKEISKDIDVVALLIPFFLADPGKTGNPGLDARIDIADYLQKNGVPHIIIQPSIYTENLLGPWTAPNFCAIREKIIYSIKLKIHASGRYKLRKYASANPSISHGC